MDEDEGGGGEGEEEILVGNGELRIDDEGKDDDVPCDDKVVAVPVDEFGNVDPAFSTNISPTWV